MEIRIPAVGESVVEALLGKWMKSNGEIVAKDDILCELETDKITFTIQADSDGQLKQLANEGETLKIGALIGTIEAGEAVTSVPPSTPSARRIAESAGVDIVSLQGSGKRGQVRPEDVVNGRHGAPGSGHLNSTDNEPASSVRSEEPPPYNVTPIIAPQEVSQSPEPRAQSERRVPMTPIRKRIAERLLVARQQTAMLTTFNEVNMSRIMELRQKHSERYQVRFGVKPGLMPFFVKSCCEALREFPEVNARIDGTDIVYHDFCDIGIAVGGERGLVVPVLKGADRLRFREIEERIAGFGEKVRTGTITIADLEGGTFTITNGGVYGSMLSTPIINPPQSGVLGMHAITDRAVVVSGEIVIRPMMYLALSYDHRIIDGRGAVQFLKRVKELLEEPEELLLEG